MTQRAITEQHQLVSSDLCWEYGPTVSFIFHFCYSLINIIIVSLAFGVKNILKVIIYLKSLSQKQNDDSVLFHDGRLQTEYKAHKRAFY